MTSFSSRSFIGGHFGNWLGAGSTEALLTTLLLQDKTINVITRAGHRACFHVTMLTDMVILVTFGNGAQQITPDIFQCSTLLYHTEYDSL